MLGQIASIFLLVGQCLLHLLGCQDLCPTETLCQSQESFLRDHKILKIAIILN